MKTKNFIPTLLALTIQVMVSGQTPGSQSRRSLPELGKVKTVVTEPKTKTEQQTASYSDTRKVYPTLVSTEEVLVKKLPATHVNIQVIDNNLIVPLIVSSKEKINALFAILAVIAGNSLWGVSGMFLSIPLLAVVKVIFDHIEPLKPWGFLLGDTLPTPLKIIPIIKKIKTKILK